MKCGEFGIPNIVNFALVDLVYKGDNSELVLFNMYDGDDRLKDIQHANKGPKENDTKSLPIKLI